MPSAITETQKKSPQSDLPDEALTELNHLKAQLAERDEDTARLDWLEAQSKLSHLPDRGWIARDYGHGFRLHETSRHGNQPTARQAIDAARDEGEE